MSECVKRLFYDLETSPNIMFSWRAGNKINLDAGNIIKERAIICICYKWEDSDDVGSIVWDRWDDKKLIEDFVPIANEADELVAHNGNRFDIRWLNGRHLLHGLPPIPEYKTVDTCLIARRKFYLNSYKLDYLAKMLLGEGKIKTEFDLWKNICLYDDKTSMDKMVEYCKKDVVLLQRVWERLMPYCKPQTHVGVSEGEERWTCPGCGSAQTYRSKIKISAGGVRKHQMACKLCGRYYTIAEATYNDYLNSKSVDMEVCEDDL